MYVGRTDDYELLASEIQDKESKEVKRYYLYFKKHWKELAEHPRIAARIAEGEAKRTKRSNLESLLAKKVASVKHPMQELELNYPTTKGKVYSEEEDRYLLCRLHHYGMRADEVYERIKRDISEFPVFRFDWFFKSRSVQELQRRCNTLLGMIEKEAEAQAQQEVKTKGARGKVSGPVGFDFVEVRAACSFDVCPCRNEGSKKFRRTRMTRSRGRLRLSPSLRLRNRIRKRRRRNGWCLAYRRLLACHMFRLTFIEPRVWYLMDWFLMSMYANAAWVC
jgi:hypothetical protein